MNLGAVTPVLRIFDEAKARAFYVDFLGFQIDWQHRFEAALPLYLQVSRQGCVLHLSEHYGDACPGARVRIACEDVDALQRELIDKQDGYARPQAQSMPWGMREMTLHDPFGNRLTFHTDEPQPRGTQDL